ncbi:MAG: response regulator transcription factor [Saprospiraceae bacterium]|nr:response regulator transcription factor [Saprospiraceae bacterium]
MIKAIIIDDEKNCIEMLEWLLKNYCPTVQVMATCSSGESGIDAITRLDPQLVFLDIEMPKMNGFDLLEQLNEIHFEVVFTTAYDNFAIRAFKYAALNYLLKPIDPDELQATIRRMDEKLTTPSREQMDLLFQNLLHPKTQVERIALSTDEGLVFVQTTNICYCKAESNYTFVVLADGKRILVAKTLKEIDETLSGKDFFRVHNSYLVNINHIQKFVRGDGGYIVMPDKTEITISRSKKDEFFQLFAKF